MSELRKMTRMGGDLRKIAKLLQGKGRNGDTILAHINPDEAALLRDYGGAGTANPDTGLLEFYNGDETDPITGLPTPLEPLPVVETGGFEGGYAEVPPGLFEGSAYTPPPQPSMFADQYRNQAATSLIPDRIFSTPTFAESQQQIAQEPLRAAGSADKGFLSGVSKDDKLRLGLGLAGGVQTALTARKARQGAQEAANQIRALGQPYAQRGQAELSAAQRGELSPVGQQQLDAMRARAAQAQAQRGGVGAAQAQRAEEELRQRLNAAREDFGLKLTGIGDQYTAKAIQEGIRADQEIASLYSSYFGNLMKMAAPTVIQATQPAKG
jgi:hypothetical protein